jgi:hypothetical protein
VKLTPDTWTVIAVAALILAPAAFLVVSDIRYRLKGHAERRKAGAVLFAAMVRAAETAQVPEKSSTEEKGVSVVGKYSEVCPVCNGRVGKRSDGSRYLHLVACEGGGE